MKFRHGAVRVFALILATFFVHNEVAVPEIHAAAQETPAVKAQGTASVRLDDWVYAPDNSNAKNPVPESATNGTDNVTYYYKKKSDPDTAYQSQKPSQAGDYTVKAVFAQTDAYGEITAVDDFTIKKAMPKIDLFLATDEERGDAVFALRVAAVGEAELTVASDGASGSVTSELVHGKTGQTGIIRFHKTGKVHVIIGMEECGNYKAYTVATEIEIQKAKKPAAIVLEQAEYRIAYGEDPFAIKTVLQIGDAQICYSSDDPAVASVDAQGNVTAHGTGQAVITASMEATEDYTAASGSAIVYVEKAKTPDTLPFDGMEEPLVSPDADKAGEVSLPEDWAWENPDAALAAGGITAVKAVYAGNDNYERYEKEIRLCRPARILQEASDTAYTIGQGRGAVIRCTGELSEFLGLLLDGAAVGSSDYTLAQGSTILTLSKSYMDGLASGQHTVTLLYRAGAVDTALLVKPKAASTGGYNSTGSVGGGYYDTGTTGNWQPGKPVQQTGGTDGAEKPSGPQDGEEPEQPQEPEKPQEPEQSEKPQESGENTHAQVKSVKLSKTLFTYSGKARKPSVLAVDTDGRQIPARYYSVTYKDNRKVGKATAVIRFRNGYSGTVKRKFTIRPAGTSIQKLTAASFGFSVKWAKKTAQTDGYQIQYSGHAGFQGSSTRSVWVKKASTARQTIKKLKAGKKYYVRIRTYKTVKAAGKSTRIYSAWSSTGRVQTFPGRS